MSSSSFNKAVPKSATGEATVSPWDYAITGALGQLVVILAATGLICAIQYCCRNSSIKNTSGSRSHGRRSSGSAAAAAGKSANAAAKGEGAGATSSSASSSASSWFPQYGIPAGLAGGGLLFVAAACNTLAVQHIGLVGSTLGQLNMAVAGVWGMALFKELRHRALVAVFGAGLAVACAGAVLLEWHPPAAA